jgi:hypothetical protein
MSSPIVSQYRDMDSGDSYTPTNEEAKVVSHVKEQVTTSDRFKRPLEKQIYLSLATYMGKQNVRWNSSRRMLEEIQMEEWEETPNTNIVRAAIDTLTARTTENQPVPEAVPATTDEDDQSRARLSSQYLSWRWHELDMGLKDVEFTQLLYITGTAIFKVAWDPEAGDVHDFPDDSVQAEQFREVMRQWELMGAEDSGVERPQMPKRPAGEDQCEVLNILEWGWDPGCKDATLKNCHWAFHRSSMHIDEVRARWEKGRFLSPDTGFSRDAYTSDVLRMFRGDTANSDSLSERIEIVEYFEKPSPRYPKGLYVVVGGNMTLEYKEELPYGELPFIVARHKTVPGRLPGIGAIPDLLDAQTTLNKFDKEYRENLALTGNTQYFVEEGSLQQELTKQPGAVNYVKKGRPFPQARVAPQPNYGHSQLQAQCEERIWNLAGVSDLARGKIPAGLSGRAVGMATDLEATMMGPTIREKARCYKLIGHRLLKYARDYMEVPRMVRIAGNGMMPEVFEFKRSDITSCDVTIEISSLLPRHPSYRREQIIMMFERGIFGSPQDPVTQRRARQMLEFGDVSQIYGDNSRARQYAREINSVLRGGNYVHPRPWGSIDDYEVQREERYKYMLSADYRALDPQVQMLFERNLAWMDFYLGQMAQGVAWWSFLDAPEGTFPPSGPPPQQQQEPQQLPQPEPVDAFGMAPEDMMAAQVQMAPGAGGMTMDQVAQLAAMQQQMGGAVGGLGASELDNAIPELNNGIRGPGVGEFDIIE